MEYGKRVDEGGARDVGPSDAGAEAKGLNGEKDPLIGAVLTDDFRVVKPLGFGAYARVYLAEQLSVGRRNVALKILHSVHVKKHGKAAMAALKREASYLAMLGSPVFPRILRTGMTPDGLPFFAMEFVSGQTLDSVLKTKKTLASEQVVMILDAVSDGLSEMHGRDIIHRDLKTGNIVIEETTPGCLR
ncbi:MAG: protein kinase, partial [Deltaproteobacteria bacterium]|nr:protein kinase [Deltaproteobacteria bacterium]